MIYLNQNYIKYLEFLSWIKEFEKPEWINLHTILIDCKLIWIEFNITIFQMEKDWLKSTVGDIFNAY